MATAGLVVGIAGIALAVTSIVLTLLLWRRQQSQDAATREIVEEAKEAARRQAAAAELAGERALDARRARFSILFLGVRRDQAGALYFLLRNDGESVATVRTAELVVPGWAPYPGKVSPGPVVRPGEEFRIDVSADQGFRIVQQGGGNRIVLDPGAALLTVWDDAAGTGHSERLYHPDYLPERRP